ncbi:MAG: hypothetical protein IRY99_26120, partial [Isosphaeraceae bacterium]|nr:hypothetical protein [Isosphaeraceae bacterium]
MPRQHRRLVRIVRVSVRRTLRRWDRDTPEWLRWLTPWGTSLSLHALLLLLLALIVYASAGRETDSAFEAGLAAQLAEDLTAEKPSDHAGDPFTHLTAAEPPSLLLHPEPNPPDVINVPALPPSIRLGEDLQLQPPGPAPAAGAAKAGRGTAPAKAMTAPFSGRQGEARAK